MKELKPGDYARHRIHLVIGKIKSITMDGWEMEACVDKHNGGTYPPAGEFIYWSKNNILPATKEEYEEQLARANKKSGS